MSIFRKNYENLLLSKNHLVLPLFFNAFCEPPSFWKSASQLHRSQYPSVGIIFTSEKSKIILRTAKSDFKRRNFAKKRKYVPLFQKTPYVHPQASLFACVSVGVFICGKSCRKGRNYAKIAWEFCMRPKLTMISSQALKRCRKQQITTENISYCSFAINLLKHRKHVIEIPAPSSCTNIYEPKLAHTQSEIKISHYLTVHIPEIRHRIIFCTHAGGTTLKS